MKISEFRSLVASEEGLKKEMNIAQISEALSVINELTEGVLYCVIRLMKPIKPEVKV